MTIPEKPLLIIVAGPNGAGKSTLSRGLSDKRSVVFDPDKESQKIHDKYPTLPAESIHYFINNNFQDQATAAIKARNDFTLETNFRDYQIMDIVDQFKNQGYQTCLIYFLLNSELESIDRVATRVKKGGHHVDNSSVRLNYTEGLENLKYFASRFDKVLVLNASGRTGDLDPLLNLEANKIKFVANDIPNWAEPVIQPLMAGLLSNPEKHNDPPTGLDR